MTRRAALILLVALGLAPGLYWREALPPPNTAQLVFATRIVPAGARIGGPGGPLVEGVWRLTSPNDRFGSYSALLAHEDGSLLALSDRGQFMRLPRPPAGEAEFGEIFPHESDDKRIQDVEAATRDPATGRIWLGLEGRNAIVRTNGDFGAPKSRQPPEMQDWPHNGGPESLLRLADGKFLALSEDPIGPGDWQSRGLLFASDPVAGARPQSFTFSPPRGLYPSDMARLPDGRVLVLARGIHLAFPPHFTASLLLADPTTIRPGKDWRWQLVAEIGGAVPYENYEGVAVSGGEDGGPVTIWLICDDNQSLLIQHTMLVKLRWRVPAKV